MQKTEFSILYIGPNVLGMAQLSSWHSHPSAGEINDTIPQNTLYKVIATRPENTEEWQDAVGTNPESLIPGH